MEKIFLFDINGVILEGYDLELVYKEMNCTCSYDDFKSIFLDSELYYNHESGLISTDKYIEDLKKHTGSNIDKEEYIKLHYCAKGKYSEQAKKLINYLKAKNYKVGILSNLKKMDVQYFFDTYYTDYFDYEFYSCFSHGMKPGNKIYEEVAQVTNPRENEVYFFDDLEENCEAAKRFGIKAICTRSDNIIDNYKKYVEDDEIENK